jgi:hypothetical protein
MLGFAGAANAGTIPYPSVGTPITIADYGFTAGSTGSITGTFIGSSAQDNDFIAMFGFVGGTWVDLTTGCGGAGTIVVNGNCFIFENHATSQGQTANFGDVTAGEALKFEGYNAATSTFLSSIAGDNGDGKNHFYSTDLVAGQAFAGSPAGTFMGLEDLLGGAQGSDYDYNDDQYIFQNLVPRNVPEPGTVALFGAALAGFGGWRMRRKAK